MTKEEIEIMVLQRYRITDREQECGRLKQRRDELRKLYRERLRNEYGIKNTEQVKQY